MDDQNKQQRIVSFCQTIITIGFYSLFIIVPLILTPWNYELFEYNKMMTVYGLTTIIVTAWIIKSIYSREIRIRRTILDIPIGLFFLSQLISAIFSMDPHVSWLGYYSRFNGGMLSIISYVILFYAFVSNIGNQPELQSEDRGQKTEDRKETSEGRWQKAESRTDSAIFRPRSSVFRLLVIILVVAFLVSLYGIAEHFGIDKNIWVQDVQNRVFSTLGQPNWLAAYLVALIPLSMALALKCQMSNDKCQINEKIQSSKQSFFFWNLKFVIWLIATLVFFLVLLFTRSRSGMLAFLFVDILFWATIFLKTRCTCEHPLTLSSHPDCLALVIPGNTTPHIIHFPKHIMYPFLLVTASFAAIVFFVGTNIDSIDRLVTLKGIMGRDARFTMQDSRAKQEATASADGETAQENGVLAVPTPQPKATAPLLETGITGSDKIRSYVWQAAVDAWRSSPKTMLIGTGTETFAFAFFQFKPIGHNMTSEWDFLYNKAHNEYLNYLTTTGVFGLVTYLAVIVVFIGWFIQCQMTNVKVQINNENYENERNDELWLIKLGLFFGWMSILITNFFGFSVVIVQLFFFLIPAMLFVWDTKPSRWWTKSLIINEKKQRWISIIVAILVGIIETLIIITWRADTLYATAYRLERAGVPAAGYGPLAIAIALNPNEPVYHDEMASILGALALADVSAKNTSRAAELARQALVESDIARAISPNNVNFVKTHTKILFGLGEYDNSLYKQALQSILRAHALSPSDPKITYNVAIVAGRMGDATKTIEYLTKTITLKPNYRDAYYALSLVYKDQGDTAKAQEIIQTYLTTVDPNDKEFLELIK